MKKKVFIERQRLRSILHNDEKGNFLSLLEDHPGEITESLVEKCAAFGAKKCLLSLLNGELCEFPPTLNDHTALAYAARCCPDPQILSLMLNQCNSLSHVNVKSTSDSLIKLIILLCSSETKPILDSVRLLAQHTYSINSFAWNLVMNGELKHFVALLLVARDKVMVPFNTGLTIDQWLTIEIESLPDGGIGRERVEYKNTLMDAKRFLDLFEKAGDALSLYCSSMHKIVPIERTLADVCEELKKSEVDVSHDELVILDQYFIERRGPVRIDFEKSLGPFDSQSGAWLFVPPVGEVSNGFLFHSFPSIKQWEPISSTQKRLMSNAREISKPLEHAQYNLGVKKFAHIAMKLKKGFRVF